MTVGPMFSDPLARQLYAKIAAIEEQHVTQYESIVDPSESWMEKWLLHEANEVYNYMSCLQYETNATVKSIWQRFLDYELGQLHFVMDLFKRIENRDRERFCRRSCRNGSVMKATGSLSRTCSTKKCICALKARRSWTGRIPIQHPCGIAGN
jgi:hypothetical protein